MLQITAGLPLAKLMGASRLIHPANMTDTDWVEGSGEISSSQTESRHGTTAGRWAMCLSPGDSVVIDSDLIPATRDVLELGAQVGVTQFHPDGLIGINNHDKNHDFSVTKSFLDRISGAPDVLSLLRAARFTTIPDDAVVRNFVAPPKLVPHVAVPETDRMAEVLGVTSSSQSEASLYANNKWYSKLGLLNAGVNAPEGQHISSLEEARLAYRLLNAQAAQDIDNYTGQVWLKKARGSFGRGVLALENEDHLVSILEGDSDWNRYLRRSTDSRQFLFLDRGLRLRPGPKYSPSAQIFVGEHPDDDRLLFTGYQILVKKSPKEKEARQHAGNFGPVDSQDYDRIMQQLPSIAHWMRSIGAFGIAGIDFIVSQTGKVFAIEINYRLTGCSAQGTVFNRFAGEPWARHWAALSRIRVDRTKYRTDHYWDELGNRDLQFRPEVGGAYLVATTPPAYGLNVIHGGLIASSEAGIMSLTRQIQAMGVDLYGSDVVLGKTKKKVGSPRKNRKKR